MATGRVRTLVAGWGAVLGDGGSAAYTAVQWGPSLVTALLVGFALAGGLLLTGRERALYRYVFALLTAVAAVIAGVFYVREGVVTYTPVRRADGHAVLPERAGVPRARVRRRGPGGSVKPTHGGRHRLVACGHA